MHDQTLLRWHTHEPVQHETAWKDLIDKAVPGTPWAELSLHQGNSALSLIARSGAASQWLQEHVALLARTVMQRMGGVTTMESIDLSPSLRHAGGRSVVYELPTAVVVKRGPQWQALNGPQIEPAAQAVLLAGFKRQIIDQLCAFASSPEEAGRIRGLAPKVEISLRDCGRPMPVKVALPADATGRREERWVMCRLGMRLESPWRFEGDFALGKLTGLGYGRLFRTAVLAAMDRERDLILEGAAE